MAGTQAPAAKRAKVEDRRATDNLALPSEEKAAAHKTLRKSISHENLQSEVNFCPISCSSAVTTR